MLLNDRKINSIISERSNEVEERCDGYRREVISLISDILEEEKQNRIRRTNIQKNIDAKCDKTAQFLLEKRGKNFVEGDDT